MGHMLGKVAVMVGSIVLAGILLDEAGKGTFGSMVKDLANKATHGYGQGA